MFDNCYVAGDRRTYQHKCDGAVPAVVNTAPICSEVSQTNMPCRAANPLEGSWVVIRVPLKGPFKGIYRSRVISRATILITHVRGPITPLITTHEPPSTPPNLAAHEKQKTQETARMKSTTECNSEKPSDIQLELGYRTGTQTTMPCCSPRARNPKQKKPETLTSDAVQDYRSVLLPSASWARCDLYSHAAVLNPKAGTLDAMMSGLVLLSLGFRV